MYLLQIKKDRTNLHNTSNTNHRWDHKEKIDPSDNPHCGFPVCAMIDQRPKRFSSMCKFLGHLKVNNLDRRFFHVQKGDCADASKYKYPLPDNKNNPSTNSLQIVLPRQSKELGTTASGDRHRKNAP